MSRVVGTVGGGGSVKEEVRELPGGVGKGMGIDSDGLASTMGRGRESMVLARNSCSLNTTSREI